MAYVDTKARKISMVYTIILIFLNAIYYKDHGHYFMPSLNIIFHTCTISKQWAASDCCVSLCARKHVCVHASVNERTKDFELGMAELKT